MCIRDRLNSGQINFNNIKAGIQLDFRLVPWAGILDEDNPDEFNIIVDSLQLYNNTDGDITYLPDDGKMCIRDSYSAFTPHSSASLARLSGKLSEIR